MFKVYWKTSTLNDLFEITKSTALQIKSEVESYLVKSPKDLGKPLTGIWISRTKNIKAWRDYTIPDKIFHAKWTGLDKPGKTRS